MAKIEYKIGGKYNSKGEKQALKGIKNLQNQAKAFNNIVKGFVGVKVFKELAQSFSGATEKFYNQQDAETKLLKSVQNNANLTADSFRSLKNMASALQGVSTFGDEEILNQEAYLSTLGLTEDQIKATMKASIDMAASGVMPLDQAVKSLAKTYSGTAGTLSKISPDLANLTKEELENGAAVELVAAQYAGMAETMANTFQGKDAQFKNIFGDLKEQIGEIGANLKYLLQDFLLPKIKQLMDVLAANRDRIVNFFAHLPELAKMALDAIKKMISAFFSKDFFSNLIKAVGSVLWEGIKLLGAKTKDGFVGIVNFIIQSINKLIAKVMENPVLKWLYEHISGNKVGEINIKTISGNKADSSGFTAAMGNLGTVFSDSFQPIIEDFTSSFKEIVNQDLPDALVEAQENQKSGAAASTSSPEKSKNIFADLYKQLGQIGQLLSGGNPIMMALNSFLGVFTRMENVAKVLNFFDTVFSETGRIIENVVNRIFAPFVSILETFGRIIGKLLEPLLTLLDSFISPLLGVLDVIFSILEPFVDVINIIMNLLIETSPLMKLFAGAFSFMGNALKFLFNNIIKPILNFCIDIFVGVSNAMTALWNGIVSVLNAIKLPTSIDIGWFSISVGWTGLADFMGLRKGSMKAASDYHIQDVGDESGSAGGYSGGSAGGAGASYTAQKDVIVNLNFNSCAVVGDISELAEVLALEIERGKRLGRINA